MTAPSLLDELEPCPFCGRGKPFDQWPCEWIDGSGANVIRCTWCHGAAPANVWNRRTHHAEIADMAKRLEAAERDAARYRWLKMQSPAGFQHQIIRTPWTLWDASIDAAMQEAGR